LITYFLEVTISDAADVGKRQKLKIINHHPDDRPFYTDALKLWTITLQLYPFSVALLVFCTHGNTFGEIR